MGARLDAVIGDAEQRVNQQVAEFERKNPGQQPSAAWVRSRAEKAAGSMAAAYAADRAAEFEVE